MDNSKDMAINSILVSAPSIPINVCAFPILVYTSSTEGRKKDKDGI